jgi:hypothetical protein
MHRRRLAAVLAAAVAAGAVVAAQSPTAAEGGGEPAPPNVRFTELGRYSTGAATSTATAAEIVAHEGNTLYVTSVGKVDVVDISNPAEPQKTGELVLPGDPTSVAVSRGLVAVSVPAAVKTDPGSVLFFRDGVQVGDVTVGALPDMVTFTPGGFRLVVANEGEPNSYNQPDSVDPEGSISLIDTWSFRFPFRRPPVVTAQTIGFADFNVGGPRNGELPPGLRISGPNASVAQDLEPEYITTDALGRIAWVSLQENNALAIVNLWTKRVEKIVDLGTSDHSRPGFGIDASDRDGRINIANWPVKGLYMPDGIDSYSVRGRTYVVTANEGDAREYTGYSDVARAKGVADTTVIPDAGDDTKLGRLTIVTSAPATKTATGANAGKVNELYSLGSRSFSIRDADGNLVWDSGDQFEQITAATFPANFNASHSNNDFDNRSDDKGPEPENVVVGKIDGRQYAFIGLERIGGVMVYESPIRPPPCSSNT